MELERFDKIHKGQRGFIIGGGTSINILLEEGFSFDQLKNEITIGANKAYKLMLPNYLLFNDDALWDDFQDELLEVQKKGVELFSPSFSSCGKCRPKGINVFPAITNQYNLPISFKQQLSTKNNTGVTCLRIAYIMGLNPIYLLGIDLRDEDVTNFNFHNDYDPERQKKITIDKVETFRRAFRQTIQLLKVKKVNVYSCSPISTLNSYIEYIPIQEVLSN